MRSRSAAFWLWWCGGLLGAVGLGLAVASVLRDSARVTDFVRVPAGCVSTIEVTEGGRYYFYSETLAEIPEVGSCSNDGRRVDLDTTPDVEIEVIDGGGESVEMVAVSDASYTLPEHEGRAVFRATLESGSTYRIAVASDVDDAVVAVGPRLVPEEQPLLIVGAVLVLASLVVMTIAFVLTMRGRRRRRSEIPVHPGGWGVESPPFGSATNSEWAPPTPQDRA